MKPLLIGLAGLMLVAPAAQDRSVKERAEELRKLNLRAFKPGSDDAKQAPDLVWKYFKAQRDRVNLDSLKWKFDTRADWEKLRDEKIANLTSYLGKFPEPPKNMVVHVTKTIKGDGFVIWVVLWLAWEALGWVPLMGE